MLTPIADKISAREASEILHRDVKDVYRLVKAGILKDYRTADNRLKLDGESVKLMRALEQGLTPKDVAKRVGVSELTIRRWDASDNADVLHHSYVYNGRNYYTIVDVETFINKRQTTIERRN